MVLKETIFQSEINFLKFKETPCNVKVIAIAINSAKHLYIRFFIFSNAFSSNLKTWFYGIASLKEPFNEFNTKMFCDF